MNERLFDRYVMIDWSAAKKPSRKPAADAIWIGWTDASRAGASDYPCLPAEVKHLASRSCAIKQIKTLVEELPRGRRALIGFDFAFGLPNDDTSAPVGRELMAYFRTAFLRGDNAEGCRFQAAAQYNTQFGGHFHYRTRHTDAIAAEIPCTPAGSARMRRSVDEKLKTQSPWRLTGQGAVGSQTIVGLAWLAALLDGLPCTVWPFESPAEGHVIAEIYPTQHQKDYESNFQQLPEGLVKDAAQVMASAAWFKHLDSDGALAARMLLNSQDRAAALREGWILGA